VNSGVTKFAEKRVWRAQALRGFGGELSLDS
jgi:menaquinone-dependent protoporphyrinogen IX oxidase